MFLFRWTTDTGGIAGMKKKCMLFAIGSMIAAIFCGCTGGVTETYQPPAPPESKAPQASAETSDAKQNTEPPLPDEPEIQDSSEESSGTESQAEDESSVESTESQEPRKYVNYNKIEADIADDSVSADEGSKVFYISTFEELEGFKKAYGSVYSLDKSDNGLSFNELLELQAVDESFFENSEAVITMQRYEKEDGIAVGEFYIADQGAFIEIYKKEPRAPDGSCCVIYVFCVLKGDLEGNEPQIKVISPDTAVYYQD